MKDNFEVPAKKRQLNLEPIGISREIAAAYIGVSETKFDELVKRDMMPPPRVVDGRRVWVRDEVQEAFLRLPTPKQASTVADPWLSGLAA